jgi:hypothetical protein
MQDHKLQVNHRYLIQERSQYTYTSYSINEWTILEESRTSYKYRNNSPGIYTTGVSWILKQEFVKKYDVIEDLGDINSGKESNGEKVKEAIEKNLPTIGKYYLDNLSIKDFPITLCLNSSSPFTYTVTKK